MGRFLPGYGEFEGRTTDAVAEPVTEWLPRKELLVEAGTIRHASSVLGSCRTRFVFASSTTGYLRGEIRS